MAIYNGDGTIFLDIGNDPTYSDTACVEAFMSEVNKKAASIGMNSSNFVRPAGDAFALQTTPRDMALLTVVASSYRELAEIWGKDSYSCKPRNRNTVISFNSTVKDTALEADYPIICGKTGTWHSPVTVTCSVICDIDGKQVAGYVHNSEDSDKRWPSMKQLMDIAKSVLDGNTPTGTVTNAEEAIAVLVPNYYTANYEQYPLTVLYEQSADTMIVPASTTKIITAVTVLDWIDDIHDTFEFVQSDMIGGSGAVFNVGDIVSFKDALYALMLPSSNQSAQAMARVVGRKILTMS